MRVADILIDAGKYSKNMAVIGTENGAEHRDDPTVLSNLFFRIGGVDEEACLVYTAAFEKEYDAVVELVFEIAFEKQRSVVARDENGKINWTCVAFNLGEGWQGFVPEQTGEETETE